jgi:hypothetical protein
MSTLSDAPQLFGRFIERDQTELPHEYLPGAPGLLPAGEDLLRAVGTVPGAYRPGGWSQVPNGFMRRVYRTNRKLWVRPCGKQWLAERTIGLEISRREAQALVEAFGEAPICTSTYQAAMRLADHFDQKIGVAGLVEGDDLCADDFLETKHGLTSQRKLV